MGIRKWTGRLFLLFFILVLVGSCTASASDIGAKLAEWRKGVWISGSGTYTIYTASHYFVLSYEGDSASANLYFGASQLEFHNRGMARKQVLRLRQTPGGSLQSFKDLIVRSGKGEMPLEADTTLFIPGVCNIKDGVIYDSITEINEDYILLATCNGDQEKIFANGISVYLPAGGGEFYSYRVEVIK